MKETLACTQNSKNLSINHFTFQQFASLCQHEIHNISNGHNN